MRRPVFFLAIALLTGLTIGLILAENPEKTACRAEPTSDCLIERALAVSGKANRRKLDTVLREMGRFETADTLMSESSSARGAPPPYRLNKRAEYRLRQGEPWRDVLADAGQMDLGELYWLGVSVARGHSWTPRNGRVPYTDAPAILDALIAQMQQRPDLTRHHRLNLAELLHRAGRNNEARSIVDADLNPRDTASQIELMGKLFGGENPRFEETLRGAFDEESAKGVPHYISLNGYVRDALEADRPDLAKEFALEMRRLALLPDVLFPASARLLATDALMRADLRAEAGEVLDTILVASDVLDAAENRGATLPVPERRLSFYGYRTDDLASLALTLDRVDAALRLAQDARDPMRVWNALLGNWPFVPSTDFAPVAVRLVVLKAAADTVSSRDLASLKARFASSLTYFADLSEHRDLAVAHLRDAIEFQKTDRSPYYRTARVIFDAAVRLDLRDMAADARQEMVRAALHSDSTWDLADAAQVFHRAEPAAR